MRFASLHLRAWGPFEQAVLDLDAPRAGLQIVHGPNERGKSTAMRAISAFLFGVPIRTDDAFGRDYATLRVGAVIEDGGQRVAWMRRKGAQRTLFEFDPVSGVEHPDRLVDPALIDRLLGGLDERRFATMHGLGAEQLREGGRSLLDAGSDLGAALFEAAGGVPRLRAVAAALRQQADELFLPGGRVKPLNATIAEWQRQSDAARVAGVRPRDWIRLRDDRDRADVALQEAEAALHARRERHVRVERLVGLGPQVTRLDALRRRIGALAGAPRLPADAAACLARALEAREQAELTHARDADRSGRLAQALARPIAGQAWLDAAAEIAVLAARLPSHETDLRGLAGLQAAADAAAKDLLRAFAAVGAGTAESPAEVAARAESLLPSRERVGEARQRAAARRGLDGRRAAAFEALGQARRAFEDSDAALREARPAVDVAVLAAAVEAATQAGDLDARAAALSARLDVQDAAIATQAAALGGPDADTIARAVLPEEAEVVRAEETIRTHASALERLRDRIASLRAACHAMREHRDAKAGARAVVGRDALEAARVERDRVLADAMDPTDATGAARALGALGPRIVEADRIADARFDDASRLAEIESADAKIAAAATEIDVLDAELERAGAALEAVTRQWLDGLRVRGLPASEPAAWRGWAGRRQRLLDALAARDRDAAERRALLMDRDRHLDALRDGWRASGLQAPQAGTLATLLAVSRHTVEAAEAAARERQRLDDAVRHDARARAGAGEALAALEEAAGAAAPAWAAVAAALNLSVDASPDALEARLEAFDALRLALSAWETSERERRVAAERIGAFAADAAALAARLGIAPPAPGAEPAFVVAADAMLADARTARMERDRMHGERATLEQTLETVRAQRDQALAMLEGLRVQAGADDLDALRAAVAAAVERDAAERDALGIESTIRETTGAAHDAMLAELAGSDPAALEAEREALRVAIDELERHRREALERRTLAQAALDAVDGDGAAADAAEAVRDRLAASGRLAVDVARLQLARELLDRAVQRHAQRAQGPLLASASTWFARITGGRWVALRPDWSDDGQVLRAERDDGTLLAVERLSEGTADQLFLALRMAALDVRLASAPPVPLLLDDVLMTFDDDRAARTLQALAELGTRNQVVYFTHHAHLVALARSVLPPGACSVTELRRGSPGAERSPQPEAA
jgi:uncharacterized protein YhaN